MGYRPSLDQFVTHYSIVTFVPTNEFGASMNDAQTGRVIRVPVKVEGDWVMRVGLDPDVNQVQLLSNDYHRLAPMVGQNRQLLSPVGRIEFWDSVDPCNVPEGGTVPEPSAMLWPIYIADVVPVGRVDVPVTGNPEHTWSSRFEPLRMHLADVRWMYRSPRGGVLLDGVLNKKPLDKVKGVDAAGRPIVPTETLIRKCLTAMGLVPTAPLVDGVDESTLADIEDVQWKGTRAPEALKEILDACGIVACPDWVHGIKLFGEGVGNYFNPDWEGTLSWPAQVGVGNLVVITSAPQAILNQETISGIGAGRKWEYVILDATKTAWVTVAESGVDGQLAQYNGNIGRAMLDNLILVAEANRFAIKNQLGYCIRLNDKTCGPMPLMRRGVDGNAAYNMRVEAKIAIPYSDFVWKQAADFVTVPVDRVINGNIISTSLPLLKLRAGIIEAPNALVDHQVEELDGEDVLKVTVIREMQTGAPDWRPKFFVAAFEKQPDGTIKTLSDVEADEALKNPAAAVIHRPDLHLLLKEGVVQGTEKTDLIEKSKALAIKLFGPSESVGDIRPNQVSFVMGFVQAWPSGRQSEVRWSQDGCRTSVQWGALRRPAAFNSLNSRAGASHSGAGSLQSYPGQVRTADARQADGVDGAVHPVVAGDGVRVVMGGGGGSEIRFKITASTQDGTNKRWTYTARKQIKTSAGYGGWAAAADVADYTLLNSIEVSNGATGLWGNGVNSTNLPASPATMTIQPVPNGVIVRAWVETFTPSGGAASIEYWFSYENGVDGSCA